MAEDTSESIKPGSQEVGQAQLKESPADRAVNKTLKSMALFQSDLLAAGFTEEQIQAAKTHAERRIRAEFQELEKQDPLSRINQALRDAAQTEEERLLVEINVRSNTFKREHLVRIARGLLELRTHNDEDEVEWRRNADGTAVPRALLPNVLGGGPYTDYEGRVIAERPPHELQERFLRNLGVLEEDQSLQDLLGARYPQYNMRRDWTRPMPTGPLIKVVNEPGMRERHTTNPTSHQH